MPHLGAGGHRRICDTCGATQIAYNSCRNRHCPKCQTVAKQRWLDARSRELLPVEYFHVVFTLPHELNRLAQGNPRTIYTLLFRTVAATLATFAKDPRHLGGGLGVTAVLHTWGQNLSQHIHLHCIVTGGALSADGSRWIDARPGFLFPVRALSKVFRGKYLDALCGAFESGKLALPGDVAERSAPAAFAGLLVALRRQDWVVYAKRPFAGPKPVLEYLGRYTHRVAISNDRIVAFDGEHVRFRWKDYADGGKRKTMELAAEEFIRRFLLHIVPDRFVRIRHFGILANRVRADKLGRCRQLLGQPPPSKSPSEPGTVRDLMLRITGIDIDLCPACRRERLAVAETLDPTRAPPDEVLALDSS